MSQSKEITRESEPDAALGGRPRGVAQPSLLVARLRALLEERGRLQEQLQHVDRQIELLRDEASEDARREAARLRESPDDRSFTIVVGDFLSGAAEPPADVEREDLERCLGKVVVALRRGGDALSATELHVRYQPRSGRVVAIGRKLAADECERQLYRRFDVDAPGAA
jgi:hypothetical protein